MQTSINEVRLTAISIKKSLDKDIVSIYKDKLILDLNADDHCHFIRILLELGNLANVIIGFMFDLIENFEENKKLAIAFINELIDV